MSNNTYPRVLLFDIGGVCVVSPFQAILDYEKRKGIPVGWVNYSIANSPSGAWGKLERGEVLLDDAFFAEFKSDLTNEERWRAYHNRQSAKQSRSQSSEGTTSAAGSTPPLPDIDSKKLFWEMMRVARKPDPHMFPALKRLRQIADASNGKLVLAALSNTSIFPPGHPFNDEATEDGKFNKELRSLFDLFISSAHVGMRKPEERIYRYTVTRLHEYVKLKELGAGVRPQDITFLDDIGTNLRTAKKVGMNTIKVQLGRADKAVAELERLTGLSLANSRPNL